MLGNKPRLLLFLETRLGSNEMQTFTDIWKDTFSFGRIKNEVEVVVCQEYHIPQILYFTAEDARKIGRALIELANEIEPPKPTIDVTKRDCTSYLGW